MLAHSCTKISVCDCLCPLFLFWNTILCVSTFYIVCNGAPFVCISCAVLRRCYFPKGITHHLLYYCFIVSWPSSSVLLLFFFLFFCLSNNNACSSVSFFSSGRRKQESLRALITTYRGFVNLTVTTEWTDNDFLTGFTATERLHNSWWKQFCFYEKRTNCRTMMDWWN